MAQNARETSETHYCGIGLWNPKNGFNIGGALRACGCLGGDFMVVSGSRFREFKSDFRNMDTEFARKRIPLFLGVDNLLNYVPYDCEIVVVERCQNSYSLPEFKHPRRSFYIFGGEDTSVPTHEFGDRQFKSVHIPTTGSLNLASACYITLYDRISKINEYIVNGIHCPYCSSFHNKQNNENNLDNSLTYHCNSCGKNFDI